MGLCRVCDRAAVRDAAACTCSGCVEAVGDLLAEVGRLHSRLDPVPGSTGGARGGRGAPGFRSSAPARLDVLVLTDRASRPGPGEPGSVWGVLCGWWDVAADEGLVRARWAGATVSDAVAELASDAALEALTRRPWVSDLVADCRVLRGALRRALGDVERLVPIGACPEPATGGGTCGGLVRARVFGEAARCARCGASWAGREALRSLAARLGDALADAPGVARYLGVPESTVRTWASRDGWTVYRHGRRRLYSLAEARASWSRRRVAG